MAVFISYKSDDLTYVKTLAERLESAGIAVWYDREIRAGEVWSEELQTNILKADSVLVVLSPNSVRSRFVIGECEFAERNTKHIVPLVIGDLKETEIPLWILHRSYVDARKDYDPLPDLRRSLSSLQAGRSVPSKPTPRPAKTGVLDGQNARLLIIPDGGRIAAAGVALHPRAAGGAQLGLFTSFPGDGDVRQMREAVRIVCLEEVPENTVAIGEDLSNRLGLEHPEQDPWELAITGIIHHKADEICLEVTVEMQLEDAVVQLERHGDLAGRLLHKDSAWVEVGGETYRVMEVSPPTARKTTSSRSYPKHG